MVFCFLGVFIDCLICLCVCLSMGEAYKQDSRNHFFVIFVVGYKFLSPVCLRTNLETVIKKLIAIPRDHFEIDKHSL